VYYQLKVQNTNLKEILDGTFAKFKFTYRTIVFNQILEYIHPDALGTSHDTTTESNIPFNPLLTNEGPNHTPFDIFIDASKFKRLKLLYLSGLDWSPCLRYTSTLVAIYIFIAKKARLFEKLRAFANSRIGSSTYTYKVSFTIPLPY